VLTLNASLPVIVRASLSVILRERSDRRISPEMDSMRHRSTHGVTGRIVNIAR